MSISKLFQPIDVGTFTLQHRVVLAPMTRNRATQKDHVPIVPLVGKYYSQRGSKQGTLLITEATFISGPAGGFDNVSGIWSKNQIEAWKEIVQKVHEKGSFIFLQLWALGRAAKRKNLEEDGFPYVAPSPIVLYENSGEPRALTVSEIQQYVGWYAQAAKNAVNEANFDGVEIHAANGYLIDQFLQDVSSHRTDDYGGSIGGRSRFGLEIIEAIVKEIGQEQTGVRISPWSTFQKMKMKDPIPQFTHFVKAISRDFPKLAYVHVVEPENRNPLESNNFIRDIWAPRPLIVCGGFTRQTAIERADNDGDLISFARLYISNPDLPTRLMEDIALAPYDSKTFYTPGHKENARVGYIDYPFAQSASMVDKSFL